MYRPPKVRPKNLTIGGRYNYKSLPFFLVRIGFHARILLLLNNECI